MKYRWLCVFAFTVFWTACSGIKITQDYDPSSEFGALTTFDWVSAPQEKTGDPRIDNPLRDYRTRAAVERLLKEKGVAKVTDGTPAFFVRYHYVLRQKIESSGSGGSIGFGMGRRGRYGGMVLGTGSDVRDYDEETLTIDFVGDKPETLLWRGIGSQRFAEYNDPDKTTRAINALVEKILSQFPPY